MMPTGNTWFAIAVRDATDLWLYLEVKRSHKSDVYVFWPYPDHEELHVSYHKDGRWWATSYGHLTSGHQRQKPDATLVESERALTTPIHLRGVLALNKPCRRARSGEEFAGIFEISADEISAERVKYTTSLAIDLAEPGAPPSVPDILRRAVFADTVPHICVAMGPDRAAHTA
jgi:hypothetical protein